ncbi:uncharacterized protein LOC132791102 [Drosophila nasuta]|uniref:uncharacterized protein LOC132791102 n=1 Tax=Drosophila nasuta TaxID=42062 RepID=UPI00295E838D|nr:uncharacterized protein LOC132791102 [Drosophila nasuta]
MQSFTGLILISLMLAATIVTATPLRKHSRQSIKSQRQVELVAASTPYPAAGFRPKIPFDLPSERQPKLEEPLATTTTPAAATSSSDVEVEVEEFASTDAQSTTTTVEEEEQEEQQTEIETNARTPSNTYGAPDTDSEVNPEDTIEVVAQAPSQEFQPPTREAVEDFAAVAIDGPAIEQQPVADLPALPDQAEAPLSGVSNDAELPPLAGATTPANFYGAPNTPARSYGAPELEEPDNELEVDESQVELVEEAEQELSEAAALDGLASGRLILLPINAAGGQFGRLILAVERPKQRRSERLRLRRRN